MNEKKAKKENTFWRHGRLSLQHRKYGIPMADVDLLMLEYNHAAPKALIEFKSDNAEPMSRYHPTVEAIRALADRADVMYFAVRYRRNFSLFMVTPLNDKASDHVLTEGLIADGKRWAELDEERYVEFLYGVCGTTIPREVRNRLFGQQKMFTAEETR